MVEKTYQSPYKAYVQVQATFYPDGRAPTPTEIVWEDGRRFSVDRVTDIRRAASTKAGGLGIRYTCCIRNREAYLFYEDENQRWFMERKEPQS